MKGQERPAYIGHLVRNHNKEQGREDKHVLLAFAPGFSHDLTSWTPEHRTVDTSTRTLLCISLPREEFAEQACHLSQRQTELAVLQVNM